MQAISANQYLAGTAALLLYLTSAAVLWLRATARQSTPDQQGPQSEPNGLTRHRAVMVSALALLAAAAHALSLMGTAFDSGALNFSFFNSLSVTAWFTVILLLLVSIGRPVLSLGLIVFPIAAVVVGCALVFARQNALSVEPELQWHVLISVIAYALLTMAAVQSILVALQDRRLRAHRTGGLLNALPSLKLMEQVLLQLLIASFLLLLLALITGFIFLDDLFAQRLVHKTILSILAVVLLAILLIGHFRFGWRGQKAARMTLGAYFALLLGYFGSKFVKELLLS